MRDVGLSSTHPFLSEVHCLSKGHFKGSPSRVTQAFGLPLGCIDETDGEQVMTGFRYRGTLTSPGHSWTPGLQH